MFVHPQFTLSSVHVFLSLILVNVCVHCDDSDGLHLTPRGNRVVFEELVNVLNCRPYLTADELPMDFPPFSEIDWKNPPSIFQAKECNTAHVLVLILSSFPDDSE